MLNNSLIYHKKVVLYKLNYKFPRIKSFFLININCLTRLMNKWILWKKVFFPIYSIKVISLYIILLLYWKSKNLSSFGFYREVIGIGVIDKIIEGFTEKFALTFSVIITIIYIIVI